MFFVKRLRDIGAKRLAIWTGLVTVAASAIAITYDFFPLPFDDENRTIFYTAALATWGTQGFIYYYAYRAMHAHNVAAAEADSEAERNVMKVVNTTSQEVD